MKIRSRLKHVAAGLAHSLISRNNGLSGDWAMGLLYSDASAPPHHIDLDMLTGASTPPSMHATAMAANYLPFIRAALAKKALCWDSIAAVRVLIQFNAPVPHPSFYYPCHGDPLMCSVMLRTKDGSEAEFRAFARCFPFRAGAFVKSAFA